ncbi:cell wall protein Pga30p [[Candida] railenensis]|uniref:Cell wall protein Pga30p n=1 Tax=[Candida] railenensis TaxID=45579 RepID=A0A9P0VZ38_9ASCO|nr:cell wall protein Pga30p [[Candida] railenensis]
MKFITFAFSVALISTTLAEILTVQFYADSTDSTINAKPVYSIRNGLVTNHFFLGAFPEIYSYDTETHELYFLDGFKDYVGLLDGYLSQGVTAAKAAIVDDKLSINESINFYASRPEGSAENFVIRVAKSEGAIPITLRVGYPKGKPETPSSPVPPSSLNPIPSGYTNATITTTLTYTEGHTTVVTVTTCPPTVIDCLARHTPQVVTTVIPDIKTTTYCPATTSPTYVPYTAYTSTIAGEATVKTTAPVTEVPNLAAKAGSITGIGILAAAAYLF